MWGVCQPYSGEGWRPKRWGHRAAAGTALAELRQGFRYGPQRCRYQGRSYEAASVWLKTNSHYVGWPPPSLNPPQSCDRKPSCFQIVWFRWLPHKQPIEASEKFSVKWPILIDILEVRDRKYGIHRPSIIMDVWSQEARVETVWDGPAWDSQCYTHYTVGQSEEGRQSHTWIL